MDPYSDDQLEQRLVAARPEPRSGFVRDLEASLFSPRPGRARARARARRRFWRPMFAVGAATAAFGSIALVFSLAGLSPLQGGGGDPASALGCVTVSEPHWVMQPTLVLDKNGGFRMDDRRTRVYRQVTRCP